MLRKLVVDAVQLSASDIHIEPNLPVTFRVFGHLKRQAATFSADDVEKTVRGLIDSENWERLNDHGSVDTSLGIAGVQCRFNVMKTDRGLGLAIRLLSSQTHTLNSCNLHPQIGEILKAPSGLILVTGPTGSGKSTTLAAMIEEISQNEAQHIITLESPIEYRFNSKKSLIRQRQIGVHTPNYETGILDALREDPDVLVVGEVRDPPALRLLLNAAETGHLVLSTLHASNAADALYRLMMSFAPEHQFSVLAQLADSLVAIISQKLLITEKQDMRVPLCEILINSLPVKTIIRKGEISKLTTLLQTGGLDGQWTFDRYKAWMDQKRDWQSPPPPQFHLDGEREFMMETSMSDAPARKMQLKRKPETVSLLKKNPSGLGDSSAPSRRDEEASPSTPSTEAKHQIRNQKKNQLRHQENAETEMVMSQLAAASLPTKRDPVTGLRVHADGRFDIPAVEVDLNELVKKIKGDE